MLSVTLHYISKGLKREEENTVRFKRLNDEAELPTVSSEYAAGANLYSLKDCLIPSKCGIKIPTGVAVSLPSFAFMKIEWMSGLGFKHNLATRAGVVDCDYSGEIGIVMENLGFKPYFIEKHEKIAQGVIHKTTSPMVIEEALKNKERERKCNGFLCTGKK